MISAANILTDLYLSLAALIGLFCLIRTLQAQDSDDPVNRRFLFGLRLTALLFVGRALVVVTGGQDFRFAILLAAGTLPLAVLLLTEALLRRHAPIVIKAVVAGGALGFGVLAFVPSSLIDPVRLWALLAFQLLGFGASGWLVVSRDKSSLSAGENLLVGRLGLSLILLIPMVAADFFMVYIRLPVQVSALGVLALCWLAIGLQGANAGHRGPVASLVLITLASGIVGGLWGLLSGVNAGGYVIAIVVVMAAMLAVAVLNDAWRHQTEAQSESLLRHLSFGPGENAVAFLRGLHAHPLVEGAIVIEEDQFSDLDPVILDRLFAQTPVLRKLDPPALGDDGAEYFGYLFDRFAATHILGITAQPRLAVALAMPAISTSPKAELELHAVQRMAALIARTESGGGLPSARNLVSNPAPNPAPALGPKARI